AMARTLFPTGNKSADAPLVRPVAFVGSSPRFAALSRLRSQPRSGRRRGFVRLRARGPSGAGPQARQARRAATAESAEDPLGRQAFAQRTLRGSRKRQAALGARPFSLRWVARP